jgi:hypothetical protein
MGFSNKMEVRAELTSKGLEAIAGNTILLRPPGTKLALTYLREQVQANQIGAVVVSRLVKVDNTVTYVPRTAYSMPYPYYNTFYGYYGTLYPVIYSPGYLEEERKVRVETNVYLTMPPDGHLIWVVTKWRRTECRRGSPTQGVSESPCAAVTRHLRSYANNRPEFGVRFAY